MEQSNRQELTSHGLKKRRVDIERQDASPTHQVVPKDEPERHGWVRVVVSKPVREIKKEVANEISKPGDHESKTNSQRNVLVVDHVELVLVTA